MSVITFISEFRNAILILFNAGITLRIIKIISDGQHDDDQDTKGMVRKHITAAILGNVLTVLVSIIKNYYF